MIRSSTISQSGFSMLGLSRQSADVNLPVVINANMREFDEFFDRGGYQDGEEPRTGGS